MSEKHVMRSSTIAWKIPISTFSDFHVRVVEQNVEMSKSNPERSTDNHQSSSGFKSADEHTSILGAMDHTSSIAYAQ